MALVLGIDEAGRGPVIGPLVISGVLIEEEKQEKLKAMGVRDSKLVLPRKRSALYKKIKAVAKKYKILVVSPKEIDHAVDGNDGLNLNWLEAIKSAEIINALQPEKVFLDCPSPNKSAYVSYIRRFLKNKEVEIIAEHKAESKFPVVAAASILSKVVRDAEIRKLEKKYGKIGPGYQSNHITKKFIEENWEKHPEIFRKSWMTWQNHKKAKGQRKLKDFD
ncbi:MAG: ribonuclease HII [Candidatus Nanoarchaeia archaeon]